jgi:phosphocarrier protein FPr
MIGLVLVSHSRPLAQALEKLVKQVASPETPIAIAAGAGENHSEFGTDAIEISEAIQAVYSPEGVLILMDLGSAILSAQMAVELLPPEMQPHIHFCSAPLVEGAISAAVQAAMGSDPDTACREARQALLPKREQLGEPAEPPDIVERSSKKPEFAGEDLLCAEFTLRNTYGLHARPAARFVQTAARFDAHIQVRNLTNNKGPVSAKSLNALATLGAVQNSRVEICAHGLQAPQALQALAELIEDNFGEGTEAPPTAKQAEKRPEETLIDEGCWQGVPIAEGFALAQIASLEQMPPPIPQNTIEDPLKEWERLESAIEVIANEIELRRRKIADSLGDEQAAIFDAHLLILKDPEILESARQKISQRQLNASLAWFETIEMVASHYAELGDPYLSQRAADVRDVGNQVLFALAGQTTTSPITFDQPVILVAEELTPTQTSSLDLEYVQGMVTVSGGPTSHSAILARSIGIPAVSGASRAILRLPGTTTIGLDGSSGQVWINPPIDIQNEINEKRLAWLQEKERLYQESRAPGQTSDGHRVEIVANAGNLADAQAALRNGAEGIGLLRTEFLFLTRTEPPSELEQYHALGQIAATMHDLPVIIRTLDVGGDKPLPYISLPEEANPFLGVRAIRISLQQPDLFRIQLRAILRAGAETANLKVMFPMIAGADEVRAARRILEEVHQQLQDEQLPHQWPIETGIMVEIPSAAVTADLLAREVDFFSIGTNDLTQYTLAAERGNPNLAAYADALHPAVLRLIHQVAQAAQRAGKWVGVCGELAGDPAGALILVGLGVKELSMNPGSIPRVKSVLKAYPLKSLQGLAKETLLQENAVKVRQLISKVLTGFNQRPD